MRKALVSFNRVKAGTLEEMDNGKYKFVYFSDYKGPPISFTMPVAQKIFEFDTFPAFFDGFLPEDVALDVFLHRFKLNKSDYFGQLLIAGNNNVGSVTIRELI